MMELLNLVKAKNLLQKLMFLISWLFSKLRKYKWYMVGISVYYTAMHFMGVSVSDCTPPCLFGVFLIYMIDGL